MRRIDFINQFKVTTQNGLPGEAAHLEVLPLNRPLTSQVKNDSNLFRDSAVAILLFEKNNSIHTALIQRQEYQGTHSKQIAFPGGKMEPEDEDLVYTARRESFEEVNLPIGYGELITELTTVYIPVSRFKVNPFIFFLEEEPEFVPDQREVESIFTFDIFDLKREDIIKRIDIQLPNGLKRKNIPYFDIEGKIVWGATALMLAELRAILKDF